MEPTEFLERHSPRMLEIMRTASPALLGGSPDMRRFLDDVDDDFEKVTSRPPKRDPLPGENVFWWSRDILCELSELTHPSAKRDPYVLRMISDLRNEMAGRLEGGAELPPGMDIGWFDETEWEEDDDL